VSAQAIDQLFVSSTALRSVNFFNGRLLTGDDLRREQATQEARGQRLGRLVGAGIAEGLEVVETRGTSTKSRPVVTVSAGLALAPSGAALELQNDVDIALYRSEAPTTAEQGALFGDCQPFAAGTYTAGAGVYVLTVAPAERGEGRAQVNGLGNQSAPCNTALEAEALKFRLIRLALDVAELDDKAHLRNRVAYACFGSDALTAEVANPFGPPLTTYGLVDTLRAQTMTDDEVPLAVIGWSIDDGIQFVDLWSVRRRIMDDRPLADQDAIHRQFRDEIDDLRAKGLAGSLKARDHFDRLPPVGLLPLAGSPADGFDSAVFFDALKVTPFVFIEGAKLDGLVREAAAFPPIDVPSAEAIRLYLVRENEQSPTGDARYLVFANGHIPYCGDAQYDLAYFDFANYAQAYC
jgi:hypothetical protein